MVGKKKATAGAGENLRRANRTKGGFLDDVDIEIVGASFQRDAFEGKDNDGNPTTVEKTVLAVEMNVEGRDEPVIKKWSCGDNIRPSEDGVTESDEGPFFVGKDGRKSKGLNENCAAAQMLDSLADLNGYDEDVMVDEGVGVALTGIKGHLNEMEARSNKGGKSKYKAGPVPVFTAVEGADDAVPVKAAPAKAAPKKAAAKAEAEDVVDAEEVEDDADADEGSPVAKLEAAVTALVTKAARKGPIAKSKLAQEIGKKYDGDPDRVKAVSLALSDKFLRAGAENGDWSYKAGQIGPAA